MGLLEICSPNWPKSPLRLQLKVLRLAWLKDFLIELNGLIQNKKVIDVVV